MRRSFLLILLFISTAPAPAADVPKAIAEFVETHCVRCHDAGQKAGRLDLTEMTFSPDDAKNFATWVKVFDRVSAGEMPPKTRPRPEAKERETFEAALSLALTTAETERYATKGRSTRRRLNRHEYENTVRDLLGAPWLPLKEVLPEDAVAHGFNKVGDALDMSHVQMARYLEAADRALRAVVTTSGVKPDTKTTRYYARDQNSFTRKFFFNAFNQAPERATFPTLGFAAQPAVRAGTAPMTDPAVKELEGVGLPCGAYEPVEPKFDRFKAPVAGRYRLRFVSHSVWLGPNGKQNNRKPIWNIPDLDNVSKGRRPEPVTVYAESPPRQLRRLGSYDALPDPRTAEMVVDLLAGETIRPDASRLFRSRPGDVRWVNPLAQQDGQPGVVYRWLEVEGPIVDRWPFPGHTHLFGETPVAKLNPADARELLARFATRAYRRPVSEAEAIRFLPVIKGREKAGDSFADAMIAGATAVLCSPEFLTLTEQPGPLDGYALAARLSYFLWNSEPDSELRAVAARGELTKPEVLKAQTQRLLDDPRSLRFVDAFLDYWLDLRKITANSPDASLYNDYYLDDWLTDSALEESRAYFATLLRENRPACTIVASDFVTVNERLATHYGLPGVSGVAFRKVDLPKDSVRGGFLTQASVLAITANGTTTSPVLRGAWIADRILGQPAPPPPPVPAVEPDLRGTTTIREQLAKHRDQASCAGCHSKIDPPGFALECFDVMGGYREKYRALADAGKREPGYGKNGQPFVFRNALPVDAAGETADGQPFKDVREFKALLLKDERQIARNLARQLTVFATGAPVSFADRAKIEAILDATKPTEYGVRSLIHALIQSDLFRHK
jgi:hypothetical protein